MPALHGHKAFASLLAFAFLIHGAPAWPEDSAPAASAAAVPAITPGQPLQVALRHLQAAGLDLVFSSSLVKPRYRVSVEVAERASLLARAEALLEPFGLALERTDAGVWYVVRRTGEPAPAPDARRRAAAPAAAPPPVEEVVVSSARYRLVRETHERRGLGPRDLESIPSLGRDPLRAVNHLPGQATLGLSARSHLRGGDSNEVLYLIDGIEIVEPFHLADFHALFSSVNPGLVNAVNVYHAGFPAAFGSRLSGVVDMELVEPQQPMEGRVNVDFVSAATHARGQAGATQWLASARRSTLDQLLDNLDRNYGRPTFHDELVRLAWQGPATDFAVGMLLGHDEISLEHESAGERAFADYDNALAWVRASHAVDDSLELRMTGSFTTVDNRRWGSLDDPADAVGSLWESRQFQVLTLRTGVRWQPASSWVLDAGLEGQRQRGDFAVDIDSRYGVLGEPLHDVDRLLRRYSTSRDGTLLTAFASARQQIGERWHVEYGARYDLQDIEPVRHYQFSPRVQLTFEGEGWRTYLNAGRYTQHQNLYELQVDDGFVELHDPQIADQLSLGVDWSWDDWRLKVEAYWREVQDPWSRYENLYNRWVLLPELHADRVALAPDRARAFGSEIIVDRRVSDTLRWSLSWALARAREQFADDWRPRPWEQRRTLRFNVDWRPGPWRVGLAAAHHSGWPTTALLHGPAAGLHGFYDAQLPDYFSLDLYTARRFELARSTLEVYFDISNLTFADNVGGYRYELQEGRLVADERRLLPAVPVLGMTWAW